MEYIAHNKSGWSLLEVLQIQEDDLYQYHNITGAYLIVTIKGNLLVGYNSWRKQWELPAGGIDKDETPRDAAIRELYEETHQVANNIIFKGLAKVKTRDGIIKYQAVYYGELEKLTPFVYSQTDEFLDIRSWDYKEDIGYVDEVDLAISQLLL